VAQRIVQAVNSPFGEKTQVKTRNATFVALPFSLPMHVGGSKPVLNRMWSLEGIRNRNGEQPIHPLYRYALVTDSAKACYYAAGKNQFQTILKPFDEVVYAAIGGSRQEATP